MTKKLQVKDELAKLFTESIFKYRKIRPSPRVRKTWEGHAKKGYFDPFFENGGGIFLRRNKKQELVAAVLIFDEPVEYEKNTFQKKFKIVTMPGDKGSVKWVESILEENESLMGKRCSGKLDPWQKDLIPWFESKGIGMRNVLLHGDVKKSLKRLRAHYGKSLREKFESEGLHIAAARTKQDIEIYLGIIKSEFTKNSQFGVKIHHPTFLKLVKKDFMNGLKKGSPPRLVFQGNKIVGGTDFIEHAPGIDGKRRAAFGFNLRPEIQGKGIARVLYEAILSDLHSRGIEVYLGATGQPGVMRIGKIMGRWVGGYTLDRGVAKHFPAGHFKAWL